MDRVIAIIALVIAACIPLAADDVVRSFARADLGLPAELTTPEMRIDTVAIAGGEAVTDGMGAAWRVYVRVRAPGAIEGVADVVSEPPTPAPGALAIVALPPAETAPTHRFIHFTIPAAAVAGAADGREQMRTLQLAQFNALLRDRPGRVLLPESVDRGSRAWWLARIHQLAPQEHLPAIPVPVGHDDLDRSIDLVTGLTAVGENLQFDRRLPVAGGGEATVALSSLPALTLREVPWERMPGAAGAAPQLDMLAQRIPADQYAVLFPSFTALVSAIEQTDATLAGPLQLVIGHGEDSLTTTRYQQQLGLELSELSKRFGAEVIDQVALTGSDPFLRAGADVALVIHAKQPALLAGYLALRQQALVGAGAVASDGAAGGLGWHAVVSADRLRSCYVLNDGDVTVISNSPVQLNAYAAVRAGTAPALAKAPEFTFFRRRYAHDANELALAVISDDTIRHWCSARWRIGDSRRVRAAAALAALQAEWIAAGCGPTWTPSPAPTDLGRITIAQDGVHSSLYGSLAFMTPIAELALDQVTSAEADAYKRFLDRYQRSWRDYLDPIAVQLSSGPQGRLAIDLSVLPLIVSSEYGQVVRLTGNASLARGAADAHAALLQGAIALDHQGGVLADIEHEMAGMLQGVASPLGWVGAAASVYADPDPYWADLMAQSDGQHETMQWVQANLARLPIGITIAVRDPLRLAGFLSGLKVMAAQAAPGLLSWDTRTYKDIPYVVVSPTAQGRQEIPADLFYLPAAEGLTITLSEALMQHAIDRLVARRSAVAAGAPDTSRPWLGDKVAALIQPAFLSQLSELLGRGGSDGVSTWMYARAWNDIAILNEWHRLFPAEDPVVVHQRLWGTRLVCPFGGTYRWNPEHLSMEPTAVDLTADLGAGIVPAAFAAIPALAAGISFEELPAIRPGDPATAPISALPHDERPSFALRARIQIEAAVPASAAAAAHALPAPSAQPGALIP